LEQLIDVGAIYNHSVVYSPRPALAQGRSPPERPVEFSAH
jgi:hypothetical protein